jgi:hypothetical protein
VLLTVSLEREYEYGEVTVEHEESLCKSMQRDLLFYRNFDFIWLKVDIPVGHYRIHSKTPEVFGSQGI